MENKIQLSKDEIIMGFVASCVEDVADTLCVDYSEVYQRMDAVNMIEECGRMLVAIGEPVKMWRRK